ncbi:MAG TPA: class III signal peptide-containing protein [Candidatus Diapherotrites archaeon]|nr:class III signal peptide-containing protein [Candidatus Diapherotrites archaeon]
MKFNKKGQGALEYLLLIGGAVLIAVIVIALLVGMGSSSKQGAQDNATKTTEMISGTAIAPIINDAYCTSDKALMLNYVTHGGTLNYVIDGVVNTESTVSSSGIATEIEGVCDTTGTSYRIQLRATNEKSGSVADSNPVMVMGK